MCGSSYVSFLPTALPSQAESPDDHGAAIVLGPHGDMISRLCLPEEGQRQASSQLQLLVVGRSEGTGLLF